MIAPHFGKDAKAIIQIRDEDFKEDELNSWVFVAKSISRTILSVDQGQLARYMDDHRCRFGFYPTYERTWFVTRETSTTFKVSEPIWHNQAATSTKPSVRQCFLYFVLLRINCNELIRIHGGSY